MKSMFILKNTQRALLAAGRCRRCMRRVVHDVDAARVADRDLHVCLGPGPQ